MPALDVNEVCASLCEKGYPSMSKKKSNSVWRLVNRMEAFRLQIVDVAVAVPVESYVLKTTGEYQDVQKKSIQSSSLSKFLWILSSTFSIDWTISSLYNFCFSCFRSCAVCDKHVNMLQTWLLNSRLSSIFSI